MGTGAAEVAGLPGLKAAMSGKLLAWLSTSRGYRHTLVSQKQSLAQT